MRGHLLALDHGRMDPAPARYMIRINGHLGATMMSAFPALAPQHHGTHTVLTGLLDQSALYGLLAEIEALGLDLLELRKLTPDRESPQTGHHSLEADLLADKDDVDPAGQFLVDLQDLPDLAVLPVGGLGAGVLQ
jgi:hypothetical protein